MSRTAGMLTCPSCGAAARADARNSAWDADVFQDGFKLMEQNAFMLPDKW